MLLILGVSSQGRACQPRDIVSCALHHGYVLLTPGSSPRGHGDVLLTLGTLILGKCFSSWGCHRGEIFLTLGTLSSGCTPHPGDIVLGTCSSPQGHHPGDVFLDLGMSSYRHSCPRDMVLSLGTLILEMCSSSWGHAPYPGDSALRKCSSSWGYFYGDVFLIPGTSSWRCAHHPRDVLLTPSTSSWGYSPCLGDSTPWTCSLPWGCPQAPALLSLHSSAPLAGAGARAGGKALQGGKHPTCQCAQAGQQPPQHRAEAVAVPVPPPHLSPLRLG